MKKQIEQQIAECPREVKQNSDTSSDSMSRRGILKGLSGIAGAGLVGSVSLASSSQVQAAEIGPLSATARAGEALQRRLDAAQLQFQRPFPALPCNDDEALYGSLRIANFSKTLPHNNLGEVNPSAYNALLFALSSGAAADFDAIPAGGSGKLANPRAANAFSMEGADSHKIDMPAVHAFASARQAAEAGEVYWMAKTRDVDFNYYDFHPFTNAAADDMSLFSDFSGPKQAGLVTPATLFRGQTPGDLVGPYISQFLYQDIPYGNRSNSQVARTPIGGDDYLSNYDDWLAVQRGQIPPSDVNLHNRAGYIRNGRDLGEYVHRDFSYQAYLNAALICMGYGGAVFDPNPYSVAAREGAFITFGPVSVLDMVARAADSGLKVAWFHKWQVHRKLRPEVFGGRIHNHLLGAANYPINSEILNSPVLDFTFHRFGTYLLPQAFPEGSPTHPSYPAGHAVIAGACVTVLKAIFDEDFVIPNAVHPNHAGTRLRRYNDEALTVGGELNKLASNIALGRNFAGVHWRADGDDGLVAGEAVAISMLQDRLRTVTESGAGYVLTRFDGVKVLITEADAQPI